MLDEINRMRKERVSANELETVKNQAIEVFPRYFATASAVADTFAADEFTGRDPKYWDTYRDKIKAVTVEDIQRVAMKYLHPDQLVILAVGNVDDLLRAIRKNTNIHFRKWGAEKSPVFRFRTRRRWSIPNNKQTGIGGAALVFPGRNQKVSLIALALFVLAPGIRRCSGRMGQGFQRGPNTGRQRKQIRRSGYFGKLVTPVSHADP